MAPRFGRVLRIPRDGAGVVVRLRLEHSHATRVNNPFT